MSDKHKHHCHSDKDFIYTSTKHGHDKSYIYVNDKPEDEAATEFKLTVKHSVTVHEEDGLNETGYLFTYEVLESTVPDLPIEVMLFRRANSQRIDQAATTVDNFITVCTISDIFEYPANEPDPKKAYFRKSKVSGVLPNMEEANRVLLRMEDLLTSLLRSVRLIYDNSETVTREIKV